MNYTSRRKLRNSINNTLPEIKVKELLKIMRKLKELNLRKVEIKKDRDTVWYSLKENVIDFKLGYIPSQKTAFIHEIRIENEDIIIATDNVASNVLKKPLRGLKEDYSKLERRVRKASIEFQGFNNSMLQQFNITTTIEQEMEEPVVLWTSKERMAWMDVIVQTIKQWEKEVREEERIMCVASEKINMNAEEFNDHIKEIEESFKNMDV